jgi:membrane-associated phospholipid phosphatase
VAAGIGAALAARRYPGVRPPAASTPGSSPYTARRAVGRRRWLLARLDPDLARGLALTLALVVIVAGGLVLAGLAVVVRNTHALAGIDTSVANWGDRHATAFSTDGLKVITDLGESWMAVIAGLVVVLIEAVTTRGRWVAPFLLATVLGDKLLTEAVKQLVDRIRPHLNPIAATLGPSFPSGHASTAAALWAAAALVAGRWWGRRAWPALVALAVGIAVAVAASRVLLDVHWLTDVVAGLALGWAWFAACTVVFARRVLHFRAASGDGRMTDATAPRAPGGGPAVSA